ncbi:MAG: hypothetical protein HETSPECPRED_009229 [Heterodermia speciosa]|uniref:Uncharacterized protein n=1 Tax=Heterodermia speciosa TaxID=116794 RepID=A0A8H3G7P4_9LECA|nr:MAG: hypothetical protein HETSPECPRED_009229 [Heterodermia speciosa]
MATLSFLHSQWFVEPPVPTHDFSGQTVIVTGANRGIGYEAIRHLLRLNAATVILAVRSVSRGNEAAAALHSATGRSGAVKIYELDMGNQESVKKFAAQMEDLDRLDAVLLNAGIYTQDFEFVDGHESTLTINVINTFLLAMLLVPTLRKSSQSWNIAPRISIVASDRHVMTNLPEWKAENTFQLLNDEKKAKMNDRYYVSKLLQILLGRELAKRLGDPRRRSAGASRIILNSFTPGYCFSGLTEKAHSVTAFGFWLLKKATARSTEVGGRTLVAAIAKGEESHGKYLNDCEVDE